MIVSQEVFVTAPGGPDGAQRPFPFTSIYILFTNTVEITRVGYLLFGLMCKLLDFCRVGYSLFHSKSLSVKSDREGFALIALYKRATVSVSLLLLFTKNLLEQIAL